MNENCVRVYKVIDNCASSPCQNGASCNNGVAAYSCICEIGFTETSCQNGTFHKTFYSCLIFEYEGVSKVIT